MFGGVGVVVVEWKAHRHTAGKAVVIGVLKAKSGYEWEW